MSTPMPTTTTGTEPTETATTASGTTGKREREDHEGVDATRIATAKRQFAHHGGIAENMHANNIEPLYSLYSKFKDNAGMAAQAMGYASISGLDPFSQDEMQALFYMCAWSCFRYAELLGWETAEMDLDWRNDVLPGILHPNTRFGVQFKTLEKALETVAQFARDAADALGAFLDEHVMELHMEKAPKVSRVPH